MPVKPITRNELWTLGEILEGTIDVIDECNVQEPKDRVTLQRLITRKIHRARTYLGKINRRQKKKKR